MQWLYSSSRLRFCIYGYFCFYKANGIKVWKSVKILW